MTKAIRVLLVDDHPVVREGLRKMLDPDSGIEVVGEASSGEESLLQMDELRPDVVLMDIRMPGMGGTEATRKIKAAHPLTPVIMLTMYASEIYVVEAIRSGAAGYVTKDASRDLLCDAVRSALHGGALVGSGLLRKAVQGLLHAPRDGHGRADTPLVDRLTQREIQVLGLVVQGYGNKGIGTELGLAEVTIKKHVQSIMGKLGASDRTHAAILGVRLGLAE